MNLRTDLKVSLERNVLLASHTSMQVGGYARLFARPTSREELLEAITFSREEGIPFMILGKGSNVIFSDEGYAGLVISMVDYENC